MQVVNTIVKWIAELDEFIEPIKKLFGWVKSVIKWLLTFLPHSPFAAVLDSMESLPYLNYLNWFIPVSTFIAIGELWLVAIGVYYASMIILRWFKVVA
ncbi:MAG: hypothetical protein NC409_11475 [Clostridium sp.]|nr:hypothetical protein [Clostridium sp.]